MLSLRAKIRVTSLVCSLFFGATLKHPSLLYKLSSETGVIPCKNAAKLQPLELRLLYEPLHDHTYLGEFPIHGGSFQR